MGQKYVGHFLFDFESIRVNPSSVKIALTQRRVRMNEFIFKSETRTLQSGGLISKRRHEFQHFDIEQENVQLRNITLKTGIDTRSEIGLMCVGSLTGPDFRMKSMKNGASEKTRSRRLLQRSRNA